MIRGASKGDDVIIHLFAGSWGTIQGKRILSQHVWYAVKIKDPGKSKFRTGDTIDCRPRWLSRRK